MTQRFWTVRVSILLNAFLALGKILTGMMGHSYALVADGIESCADVFSSLVVWGGLQLAIKPADRRHPFGHGRAETLAAAIVSLLLLAAAIVIAIQSVQEIRKPLFGPAPYTLVVLLVVIGIKETMFRLVLREGRNLLSRAMMADAWHHRSDALTSAAAFVGISIALLGGEGYEAADDWAALAASGVVAWNGFRLLWGTVNELMDVSPDPRLVGVVEKTALLVPGVVSVEKCRMRKTGLHFVMDLHVRVKGDLTVREGHEIAHQVQDRLKGAALKIEDVTIHIEPAD